LAAAGTLLTAARSERKASGECLENPARADERVGQEADPVGQTPA
jgi:hypothetical protein